MENILDTIKKMLGIDSSYTPFDVDILIGINSAFFVLNQLGVGPSEVFIADSNSIWSDFADLDCIEAIKNYVYLKTRLTFDPPVNSFVVDSISAQILEYEWRLNTSCDIREEVDS